MINPTTPTDTYKAIIDQLVHETRLSGYGSFVEATGKFSNAPDHHDFNEFISSLSIKQRHQIALMLQIERDNTIHDVLANLSWWITCRNVSLTVDGNTMPVELSGMGLHGDFVGRRDGWDWPNESNPPSA
jgi:hypothetical protein